MKVPLANAASKARDWMVEAPISSQETVRNSSPAPSICLSSRGATASGVLSLTGYARAAGGEHLNLGIGDPAREDCAH